MRSCGGFRHLKAPIARYVVSEDDSTTGLANGLDINESLLESLAEEVRKEDLGRARGRCAGKVIAYRKASWRIRGWERTLRLAWCPLSGWWC